MSTKQKTYNLNIYTGGEKMTLEVTTPIENLFDFCSMIQQQIQKGKIPMNAELHSITPINYVMVEK